MLTEQTRENVSDLTFEENSASCLSKVDPTIPEISSCGPSKLVVMDRGIRMAPPPPPPRTHSHAVCCQPSDSSKELSEGENELKPKFSMASWFFCGVMFLI
jgi:hypothetical protein